ncbi:MAG: glycosyltransferase family 2 protein, partial [Hyphomicrobiaceae bacterium]
ISSMPRVSVVIPLYQTEAYIEQALRSVLAQSFTDFEALVIDDGSQDRGPEIARSFADPRVKVITQANRGLAGARNSGIRLACGEYIALLDADDLWHPTKLERHVAQLDGDPSIDVSFSASRLIDEVGDDIGLVQRPKAGALQPSDFFCRNPVGNGSAPVLRRAALDRIAFEDVDLQRICWFDESFRQSEDIECWVRMVAGAGCRFGYVDEALTLYRVNSSGLSANVEKQLATWRKFRDKVADYAPDMVARYGRRAEAYQLRYLARRAVYSERRTLAFVLAWKSLLTFPRMLVEEPIRSIATFSAALAKLVLSSALFERIERVALQYASARPGLRL